MAEPSLSFISSPYFKRAGTNVSVVVVGVCAWTKTLTLAITFLPEVIGLLYCTCVFLVQDLSQCTLIFDLVTLTLKFDLPLINFNLGIKFLSTSDRAYILHMCVPCDKTFHMVP